MDYQIQVVTVPVTDIDQAAAFYSKQAGFALDVDYHPAGDFRVVQLTPPGSACSGPVRRRAHRRGAWIGAGHVPGRHRP
jgi:catechol 2,3-dioxygenase-like lactoylglutathione lyase family enzyme